MRCVTGFIFVLALGLVGCSENKPQEPDLEWPPDATAYFDQYGILNADCETDEDCAMVLGYYHAADRFVQMELRRRLPTGRLTEIMDKGFAELFALSSLDADSRALFSSRDAKRLEDQLAEGLSDETRAVYDAYAAGVNQWIDEVRTGDNGAVFPREFEGFPFDYSPSDIPDWTIQDSAASTLPVLDQLTRQLVEEVAAGAARQEIGDDDKFADLWTGRPRVESSILPPGWMPPAAEEKRSSVTTKLDADSLSSLHAGPALQRLNARTKANASIRNALLGGGLAGSGLGSNSWVIGPSRTESGNAIVANDAHLAMSQPAIWYLAHLDAKTHGRGKIHSAGASLAGLPSVALGQNESIAWGITTLFIDVTDWYIEELVTDGDGNPTGVMFEGKEVTFERVPFTVTFSDGTEEQHELLFVPHHGPVREIDRDNKVAITLRWTAQDAVTDLNTLNAIEAATSVEEARVAMENSTAMPQCWVVADVEGNIGYFPYNRPPKRNWATNLSGDAPPWLPLDGRCITPERCYEWTEFFDHAELPQVVNPEQGYVATANNDITGSLFDGDPTNDGYPPLQTDVVPGFRHARVVEMIDDLGSAHSPATSRQMQGDVQSGIGKYEVPGFIAIAESDQTTLSARAQKVLNALKAWQFSCPTGVDGQYVDSPLSDDPNELREAAGCTAFHALVFNCRPLGLRKDYARVKSYAFYYSVVDPTRLILGDVYWDDPDTPETETKYQTIEECFDAAAELLIDDLGLGDDETKWVWGRAQRLVFTSDLATFGVASYDNPAPGETPFTSAGGLWTVSPTDPGLDGDGFFQTSGASIRLVCEALPSGPRCNVQLPGGQSSHIDSPNYEDLVFKWLENEPIDLVFDIDEAKANAVRTVTFE